MSDSALIEQPEFAVQIAERLTYYGEAAGGRLLWMAAASAHDLRVLAEVDPELAQTYRSNSLRTAQRAHAPDDVFAVLDGKGSA